MAKSENVDIEDYHDNLTVCALTNNKSCQTVHIPSTTCTHTTENYDIYVFRVCYLAAAEGDIFITSGASSDIAFVK